MLNHQTNEDLKAFERRLTEIIACYQPQTKRWRILLILATVTTSLTTFHWLTDPRAEKVSFIQSLHDHRFFTFNCLLLLFLVLLGIHRKVQAPAIIVARIKLVLETFNLSCDQSGRLILKKPSTVNSTPNNSIFNTTTINSTIKNNFNTLVDPWTYENA